MSKPVTEPDRANALTIPELRALAIKVYHRIYELDREQFDKELVRNTRYRGDIVRQAAQELVPAAEWREVVMLIAEGSHYYGYCEGWFNNPPVFVLVECKGPSRYEGTKQWRVTCGDRNIDIFIDLPVQAQMEAAKACVRLRYPGATFSDE